MFSAQDSMKELYKKRNKAIDFNCVSVLYEDKKPIVFAINGNRKTEHNKLVIKHIKNVLGSGITQAKITNAYTVIKPQTGKNTRTINSQKITADVNDKLKRYIKIVDMNEPISFEYFDSRKHKGDGIERFFTCAEKKVMGMFMEKYRPVIGINVCGYSLYSIIKPCAICEPALPECYYLNEPNDPNNQKLKKQTIKIVETVPHLVYCLIRCDV